MGVAGECSQFLAQYEKQGGGGGAVSFWPNTKSGGGGGGGGMIAYQGARDIVQL